MLHMTTLPCAQPSHSTTSLNATREAAPGNTPDRIAWLRVSSCYLPLATPISDAKVLTGRQKPMTEVALLFVELQTASGHEGLGFSYAKRAGGPGQFAHAQEIAPALIGEDPSDIARLWNKLCWASWFSFVFFSYA